MQGPLLGLDGAYARNSFRKLSDLGSPSARGAFVGTCSTCGRGETAKCRLSIKKVINLPIPNSMCCGRREQQITVRVKEIEPSRNLEEDLQLPATFVFEGAVLQEDGSAEFPRGHQRRFSEATCASGWRLRFEVLKVFNYRHACIGFVEIDAEDLARKSLWRLLLSNSSGDAIYGGRDVRCPTFLEVQIRTSSEEQRPQRFVSKTVENVHVPGEGVRAKQPNCRKRVMIMTRGTRGDVQPYVALARGLASPRFNCEVTIVTELAWKKFIMDNKDGLPPGSIHFRPCGGDTSLQTTSDAALLTLKLGQHSDVLQSIIMSKSEQNFFTSEGCFYFWAKEECPDFIVFGFTVTHIAMIISEALQIPIVGFIMQPIRSIEARPPAHTIRDEVIGPMREIFNSTEFNAALMHIMQKIHMLDGTPTLNRLRRSRGLNPFPSGLTTEFLQYTELTKQNIPQFVPINPLALGDQAQEIEKTGMTLTDFIFLRHDADKLDSEIEEFIAQAKQAERPLVTITFSSMPVGARKILEVAVKICDHCLPKVDPDQAAHKPVVIAFVGGQDFDPVIPNSDLDINVQRLSDEKRLLARRKGAPFGLLFPLMDAVITAGGLGQISEALVAGVPALVSGILLMDQRYWAKRLAELGVGPGGIYIDVMLQADCDGECNAVKVVKNALDRRSQSSRKSSSETLGKSPTRGLGEKTPEGSIGGLLNLYSHKDDDFTSPPSWYENTLDIKERMEKRRLEQRQFANLSDVDDLANIDGIALNALKIFEAGCDGRYIKDAYIEYRRCGEASARTAKCFVCTCAQAARWLVCSQLPACIIFQLKVILCLGIPLIKLLIGPIVGVCAGLLTALAIITIWSACCEQGAADRKDMPMVVAITSVTVFVFVTAVASYMVCSFTAPRRRQPLRVVSHVPVRDIEISEAGSAQTSKTSIYYD